LWFNALRKENTPLIAPNELPCNTMSLARSCRVPAQQPEPLNLAIFA
jgi:hypothetical protein